MATQRPGFEIPLFDFAASLLVQGETSQRAQLIAEQVAQLAPGSDVVVYVIEEPEDPTWAPKGFGGDKIAHHKLDFQAGTLGMLAESAAPLVLNAAQLTREDYAHLDIRRTLISLAYVPLLAEGALVGAIELVSYERPASDALLDGISAIAQLGAPAIASAVAQEGERNNSLRSITRVTQMYDLEKVFNSNLEMDDLLATIASKVQEVMNVQAANVWMVEGETVVLMNREGADPTVELGSRQGPADGVAGKVSDDGNPVLIDDPEDERLHVRNGNLEGGAIFSLLAMPLMDRESLVGVIEVVNRLDGRPFDEDDQFVLSNVCETASNALHNASLLLAERKVEILEALVRVSQEITSTLNLDRVLETIVNGAAAVIPYERAAIALENRGAVKIKAISGLKQINPADPDIARLQEILEWSTVSDDQLRVVQHREEIEADRPESEAKFRKYFADSGMAGFYAVPLIDDQGRLGVLSFESTDPDFLTEAHIEMIRVLASQATVAMRNAQLYREVPFISVLEPVLQKKRKFMAMEKRRRMAYKVAAAAALAFLVAVPIPMRLDGNADVAPIRKAQVMSQVPAVVKAVYVHEGQAVRQGEILADLEEWQYRDALAAAQARYNTAVSAMNQSLAANNGTEAGIQQVQVAYWKAEVSRAAQRLAATHLRSPIAGVVATPHIETFVGRSLTPQDIFAEVTDAEQATVDVAIDERETPLLRTGQSVALKLDSFPTRTFHGAVQVISPISTVENDNTVFFARVNVPNAAGLLRTGMHGQGKISAGWRPAGYVLFRRPAMWIYSKLWSWFGW